MAMELVSFFLSDSRFISLATRPATPALRGEALPGGRASRARFASAAPAHIRGSLRSLIGSLAYINVARFARSSRPIESGMRANFQKKIS